VTQQMRLGTGIGGGYGDPVKRDLEFKARDNARGYPTGKSK
jgi:N-methylhydantoinase B/oxoprolinase/acetone carboxylase alpha subunit